MLRRTAVLLVIGIALAGCSSGSPSEPSQTSSETTTPRPTNVLSGREGENNGVLVVKIDDTSLAHPQIGLEDADVIYVAQVEAGLTRLAAVFSSQLPERVGPVRSARISDLDIFANYGKVAFAYSGAQGKLLPYIASANWWDLGAQRQSPSIYTRDLSRRAPWNMVLLPQALLDKAAERGQVPEAARSVGWTFGERPRTGLPISSVEVQWPSSTYVIRWNGSSFVMEQDGRTEVSAAGATYSPTTIVIQEISIVPSEFGDRYGGRTPKNEVIGSGTALVLREGRLFRVRWNRATAQDPTSFTMADGRSMPFSPGQVWVLLADQTRPPAIESAGSSPLQPPLLPKEK